MLLCAAATPAAGPVAFVGPVAGHAARMLVGTDHPAHPAAREGRRRPVTSAATRPAAGPSPAGGGPRPRAGRGQWCQA
ncbi:hypothetical protein ACWGAN_24320 [Streptomyces sp. NPDC054945]